MMQKIEDIHTEYKRAYSRHVMTTICAFLNTDGGRVLIGYNDYGDNVGILDPERINSLFNKDIECTGLIAFTDKITLKAESVGDNVALIIEVKALDKFAEVSEFASIRTSSGKNNYYLRKNDQNIRVNPDQISYLRQVFLGHLPAIANYEFKNPEIQEKIRHRNSRDGINTVGGLPGVTRFYKYMSLEAALLSLDSGSLVKGGEPSLRFIEPSGWEDQYESLFYTAIYDGYRHDERAPFLYACCFTSKKDNEAAWKIYSHEGTGLAARCVRFTLNREKLMEQLTKYLDNYRFYVGKINYIRKSEIDTLYLQTIPSSNTHNNLYDRYFISFDEQKYINALLLKRLDFEHENEIRIFAIPMNDHSQEKTRLDNKGNRIGEAQKFYMKIDWPSIIEEVCIDSHASIAERNLLKNALRAHGISAEIETEKTYKASNFNIKISTK